MPSFVEHLINRVPVSSTCKILGIGRSTYYSKLEWLYRCCLEFLETHETKQFAKMTFPRIWLNTDIRLFRMRFNKEDCIILLILSTRHFREKLLSGNLLIQISTYGIGQRPISYWNNPTMRLR